MENRPKPHMHKFTDLTKYGVRKAIMSKTIYIRTTKSNKKLHIHAFPQNPILHLAMQKVNKWAWHAIQIRRALWSKQSHSGRTDLIWS